MSENKKNIRCWNGIGIWGDCSCAKLSEYIHCSKCPVYSSAGAELFEREIPAEYFDEWGDASERVHFAAEGDGKAVFLFSCASRMFALPLKAVSELATMRMIHKLPHRKDAAIRGLANINGELVLAFDLLSILGLPEKNSKESCIIVCSDESEKFAFAAESAKGAVVPDADSYAPANDSDMWYVDKKFSVNGAEAVLINYEILIGAITKKHL